VGKLSLLGVLRIHVLCFAMLGQTAFPHFLFQYQEPQLVEEIKALVQEMVKSNVGFQIETRTCLE
jgi:hypothetical protein